VTLNSYEGVKETMLADIAAGNDVSAAMSFLDSLAKTCGVAPPSEVLNGHVRWSRPVEEDEDIPFP
jgi:hypothetical protein